MQIVVSATKVVEGISKEEIFSFCSGVNNWTKWNDDINKATITGSLKLVIPLPSF